MIASQRYEKIVEMVNERGIVNTKELAELLGVTETTIRRDCEKLENQGLLIRVHGGAKSIDHKTILSQQDEKTMDERTEQLDQKEMSRLRLSIEDLFEELREKDVFSIHDVAWAIMETNGKLSIVKKPEADQPTNQLLGLCPSDTGLEVVVISDGEFSDSSLRLCGQSRRWAEDILSQQGLSLRQVFIMTADTQGGYAIIPKQGDNLSTMKGGSTS